MNEQATPKHRTEGRQILIAFAIVAALVIPGLGVAGTCGWMTDDETPGWLQPVCNLIED